MIWREARDHTSFQFYVTKTVGYTFKTRNLLKYPNVPSATRPVPHSTENPVPLNRNLASLNETTNENTAVSCESSEAGFDLLDPPGQKFDQNDLSDLARDLGLSKLNSEILA